jgi:hypothetical protein
MKHSTRITIMATCVLAIGCRNRDSKTGINSQVIPGRAISNKASFSVKEDTAEVQSAKPIILAYSLSQSEYDSLASKDKGEYDEGYSDFSNSVSEFAEKKLTAFSIQETASRFIFIGDTVIDRKKLKKYYYGLILMPRYGRAEIFEGGLQSSEIEREARSLLNK